MECIVLAGGLGTRLQGVIGAYPKCMAEVNGKAFLYYLFQYLEKQGCTKAILSLGFKHDIVTDWLQSQRFGFDTDYVIEQAPLGTGGGMSLALANATNDNVIVLNGDTMFDASLQELIDFHASHRAETTLALKHMHNFNRYGTVKLDKASRIVQFEEKQQREEGLINGGIYAINRVALLAKDMPQKYSFEKDYLERFVGDGNIYGMEQTGYFIDIGIPEDYAQSKEDFKTMFA